jgi:seryl-tRNA synthetase
MIDIRLIREDPVRFRQAATNKKIDCDIDLVLSLDEKRRSVQNELDSLRHEQRLSGEKIAKANKQEKPGLISRMGELKERVKQLEVDQSKIQTAFDEALSRVPQPPAPDVPVGADDSENVELRRMGEVPSHDFEIADHVTLGKRLDIIDIERGVKLAGARNFILKGDGVLLHQAVLRLAFDMMVGKGFTPMTVPVLVRDPAMFGTGHFPIGVDQTYQCERDGLNLVGTAEVPLTAYHMGEELSEADLPKRYVAVTTCFRREAGAAGKDTHGLYRIHWFDKVEQVVVCKSDEKVSQDHHAEILANAEEVVQALELPYRVVRVCTGDLGQGQVEKFDIECWMPSRDSYGETHSASRFYEFQARRLNLRYRDGEGKLRYCHTLNNTVIASPRILIPILELNQNEDGTVTIPEALRPYMGGRSRIGGN